MASGARPYYVWMKNPWLKKNPFLSMWLSSANTMLGAARGRAVAQSRRQAAAMMTEGTNQMLQFWAEAMVPRPVPTPKKKRRAVRR